MGPNASLGEPVPNVVPQHRREDDNHEQHQNGNRNGPEKGEGVLETVSLPKVHAKVAGNEGEGCKEHRDHCQNHHEVVRLCTNGVEYKGGDVDGACVHLLEGLDQGDTVVEDVAEVGVSQRCDDYTCERFFTRS